MGKSLLPCLALVLATVFSAGSFAAPQNSAPALEAPVAAKINLNSADLDTLQRELLGIGATKAAAIIARREANGAFSSVDELLEVQGIGKSLLDKNRDRLTIE
jgi:competence protein ComEA